MKKTNIEALKAHLWIEYEQYKSDWTLPLAKASN